MENEMVFKSLLHTPGKCTLRKMLFFFSIWVSITYVEQNVSLYYIQNKIFFFLNIVKYYILYFGVEAYIIIGDRKKFTKNKI